VDVDCRFPNSKTESSKKLKPYLLLIHLRVLFPWFTNLRSTIICPRTPNQPSSLIKQALLRLCKPTSIISPQSLIQQDLFSFPPAKSTLSCPKASATLGLQRLSCGHLIHLHPIGNMADLTFINKIYQEHSPISLYYLLQLTPWNLNFLDLYLKLLNPTIKLPRDNPPLHNHSA